jgi:lipoprotein NlpI
MTMFRYIAAIAVVTMAYASPAFGNASADLQATMDAAKNGKFDSAIQLSTKALQDTRMPAAIRGRLLALRAYAVIAKGQPKNAQRDLDDALRTASDRDTRDFVNDAAMQGYLQRGKFYDDEQNWGLAVASYTAALRYSPRSAVIYADRAGSHLANTELDEAISDYDQAIQIDRSSSDYYVSRGTAYESKLDFQRAISDYSKAIQLDSKNDTAFGYRGRAYAVLGNFEVADRDLERTLTLRPADRSSVLWLHLVHMRMGKKDDAWLRKQAGNLRLDRWPGPAISYFLGKMSADDMVRFALRSPEVAKGHQRCDGWFYLGEEALAHQDMARARNLFRQTVSRCNAVDYEWDTAQIELRRIEH